MASFSSLRTMAVLCAGTLAIPAPVAAQQMNAGKFYDEAAALQKKGPMALMSMGRVKALMREAEAAGKSARQVRLEAVARGETPRYCPPANRSSMGGSEFMALMAAIPAAERARMTMTDAMIRIFTKKYPC